MYVFSVSLAQMQLQSIMFFLYKKMFLTGSTQANPKFQFKYQYFVHIFKKIFYFILTLFFSYFYRCLKILSFPCSSKQDYVIYRINYGFFSNVLAEINIYAIIIAITLEQCT